MRGDAAGFLYQERTLFARPALWHRTDSLNVLSHGGPCRNGIKVFHVVGLLRSHCLSYRVCRTPFRDQEWSRTIYSPNCSDLFYLRHRLRYDLSHQLLVRALSEDIGRREALPNQESLMLLACGVHGSRIGHAHATGCLARRDLARLPDQPVRARTFCITSPERVRRRKFRVPRRARKAHRQKSYRGYSTHGGSQGEVCWPWQKCYRTHSGYSFTGYGQGSVVEKKPKRTPKTRNAVGGAVKGAREVKGLTQAELAAKLQIYGWDIDRTGVVRVETGERVVSDCELIALSDVLGVTVDSLVAGAQRAKVRKILRSVVR